MKSSSRNWPGWMLTALIVLLMIASGSDKIAGSANAIRLSGTIGIPLNVYRLLGIIEIASALLFALPRTGLLGTLLLAAYLGGAIATRLQHQESILFPVIIAALIWSTATIRFPELSLRLLKSSRTIL